MRLDLRLKSIHSVNPIDNRVENETDFKTSSDPLYVYFVGLVLEQTSVVFVLDTKINVVLKSSFEEFFCWLIATTLRVALSSMLQAI